MRLPRFSRTVSPPFQTRGLFSFQTISMSENRTQGKQRLVAQALACVGLIFPERRSTQTEVCATKTRIAAKREKTPQTSNRGQKFIARP